MATSRDLQDVLPHIFLPRKLPQATIPEELEHVESVILTLFTNNFEEFARNIANNSVSIKQSLHLFKTWTSIQGNTELEHIRITDAICSLEIGQSMALYVRAQNAGLIISFPDEGSDHVIISTFPASLKSEIVLASDRTEIIASVYPALSVQVPRSNLLLSDILGVQLKDLCLNVCETAMPKTRKAGKDNIEVRDVPDPMLISKWLTCALSNSDSKICSTQDFPSIPKKVRDDVVWKDALVPFRRSGMYMTIKVVLHLSLVKEFGEILGTFIYKSVIIQFMTFFCHTLNDMDLGIQIISKISRRMYKLNQYYFLHGSILYGDPYLNKYNEFRQTYTGIILQMTRFRLNQIWKAIVQVDSKQSLVNISGLADFKSDTKHLLNHSKCYFKKEEQVASNVKFQPGSQCPIRHRSTENFLPLDTLSLTDEVNCGIQLHDIENWVQYHFENIPHSTTYASSVRELFMTYFQIGKNYYKNDPVGYSRLVITCIKIVQVFDQMVIKIDKQKIFREHRTGVEWSCISNLLLPGRQDMKMAHDLEKYFMNRDGVAIYPSLIEEQSVSCKSYSVRFAKNNYYYCLLRDKIITHGENMIASKKDELRSKRIRCQELRVQISRKSHEYITGSWNNSIHASSCQKCSLERDVKNCTASIYEKPLPEEDYKQLAVVFELIIPPEIACLRDILFILASQVCTENWKSEGTKTCFYLWAHSSQLSSYVIELRPDFVHLGSTLKSYIESHYSSKHVDYDDTTFIVNNAYNTMYGSQESLLQSSYGEIVKSACTFQIQPNSQYSNLQWMLRSTNHTQNQVLSRQVDCLPNLSLEEFKVFGSLRAGHRLQWRNIYSALSQGSLTFKAESVFVLICQSIWEAGPRGSESDNLCRDSHQDLRDPKFSAILLKLLEEELKTNSKNWNEPLVLLTLIFITARILAICGDFLIQYRCRKLLKECRIVANEWVNKIKDLLGKMTQAPHEEVTNLRNKLIECTACAAFTFSVDSDCVFMNEEDVVNWLQIIVQIDENVVINSTTGNGIKSNLLRNILRWARTAALSIEPRLQEILCKTNRQPLTTFVKKHWAGASCRSQGTWSPVESPREQVYFSEWIQKKKKPLVVEVDIVLGCFLVNGAPIGRLPQNIIKHQDFARVFQKSVFEVHTESPGIYVTAVKTNNVNYKFFTGKDERLYIIELHEDREFHLFPHTFFKNDIPPILIESFSHWWNKLENILYFRPKLYNDKEFYNWDKIEYQLDLNSDTLKHVQGQTVKLFVDMNRTSFVNIAKVMGRLEHPHFIHLIYCDETQETVINLPRMSLNFKIKKPNHILSKEYPGMRVSEDQKFGTLIGLKQGLLLKSIDFEDDWLLIVPHGKLSIALVNSGHANVNIDHSCPLNPPFFVYEFDHRLQQLKAGQNHLGWLYLSYLHAATASPLPDPFTRLTGTEKAMKILQSGHCWSFEPMKNEAISILKEISKLSPTRKYYPKHLQCMQTIEWPHGLASVAAEDAYILLTDKLMSDSQRLNFLFNKNEVAKSKRAYRSLNLRAYKRNSAYCGEQAKVSPGFDETLNIQLKSKQGNGFPINLEDSTMLKVRQLAHLGHTWTNSKPVSEVYSLLSQLLLSSTVVVQGISFQGFNQHYSVTNWLRIDFQNKWLDLYNFARIIKKDTRLKNIWTMLICLLAFKGVSVDHLLILHTVALHPFSFDDPPPYESYMATCENNFDRTKIISIFKASAKTLEDYLMDVKYERKYSESDSEFSGRMGVRLYNIINEQVSEFTNVLQKTWPTDSCDHFLFRINSHPQINISTAINEINQNLKTWFRNYKLRLFLENVGATVTTLTLLRYQNEGVPKNEIKPREFGNQFTNFLQKRRLTLSLDNFLKSEVSVKDSNNLDAENIFKCGQDIRVIRVVTSCEELCSEPCNPPVFPFEKELTSPVESYYNSSIKQSWDIYHSKQHTMNVLSPNVQSTYTVKYFSELRNHYRNRAGSLWKEIQNVIYHRHMATEFQALHAGGLLPRLTPIVFIPLLYQLNPKENPAYTHLRNLIGALCVIWTLEQRAIRCLRYINGGAGLEVALAKEILNPGHMNWSPADYPKWLILELEMDMMVRPIQIEVTEKMLNPPNNENALMQLNMGEGKTAVIIPLLIVAMADGSQLCRVTVLRSLYQINLRRLIFNLGGLLNQRVYAFPCRREMNINEPEAQKLFELHKECMQKRGVVLTRPEHRLSFQLKMYEKCRASSFSDAKIFLHLHQWLRENVRDLLDESDEILQVKYQLIYTVGEQQQLDAGSLRWTIVQDVFKLVQFHMPHIFNKFGVNTTEFRPNSARPEEFFYCRLLNADPYVELCELIANDFIEGRSKSIKTQFPDISSSKRSSVLNFLIAAKTDLEKHLHILQLYKNNASVFAVMLILRGILACGVLQLALTKRWRVNYGVNPNGDRLMAVPFRAKDVAAEKTEFGHPDVAILFTHLSYYYSGLSDAQIDQCFEYLERSQTPGQEYERWVSNVNNVDPSIRSLSGVNLLDFEQKTNHLYPSLKKNTEVINFWLSNVVFPKEAKQFQGKMVCTAWDLCSNESRHPVTGFSGTNDSALLLPLSISQKDLPKLQGTNGEVLSNLLLPENNNYATLPSNSTNAGIDILKWITRNNIRVLLDVGALILELTNEEVAKKWLELVSYDEVDAVVYFDDLDRLIVQDRQGKSSVFETSSFRARLNRCVVYLDDVHTRGTDLKMPSNFRACVTLGTGVTKDKLVQGCMRMRMLGQGHTVHFLASQEVNNSIRAVSGYPINAQNVLQWTMNNSCKVTQDNMLYWAVSGVNFAQKHSAELIHRKNISSDFDKACLALSEQCTDKEVIDLKSFYGGCRREEFIPGIAELHLKKVLEELQSKLGNDPSNFQIVDSIFETTGSQVIKRCNDFVPNVKIFAQLLEEEQEKELEQELQEERQISRPGRAKPHEHNLDEHVRTFLINGSLSNNLNWCVKLPEALNNTRVASILQKDAWGDNIFATHDFVNVIDVENQNDKVGEF